MKQKNNNTLFEKEKFYSYKNKMKLLNKNNIYS